MVACHVSVLRVDPLASDNYVAQQLFVSFKQSYISLYNHQSNVHEEFPF